MSRNGRSPLVLIYYWGALMGASNGSQIRALGQIAFIAEQFENVALYHYSNHPRDPWTPEQVAGFKAQFPNVRLVSDVEGGALRILAKLKKTAALLSPRRARRAFQIGIPSLTPNYQRLREDNPEIIYVVNYVDSLTQLNGVDGAKVVVETHDLRYFRRAKGTNVSLVSLKSLLSLRYEISALASVASLVAITRNEAYFYRNMIPAANTFYVPEYQPTGTVPPSKSAAYEYDLLFAASGNDINVHGMLRLLEIDGTRLGKFRIALCGLICERPEIRDVAAAYPNITLLNFLNKEELVRTYAISRACLSPTDGTGLNIKLVEALRNRKPVFASASSREGLSMAHDDCVFPLDPEVMTTVLTDPYKLEAASDAATGLYHRFTQQGDLMALREALKNLSPAEQLAETRCEGTSS